MTTPNQTDRERAIERIRKWAATLPKEWRAVANWQIRREMFDEARIAGHPDDAAFALIDWVVECDGEERMVRWGAVQKAVKNKQCVPPVPDWLADLIAKDATTPSEMPDPRAFREGQPFGVVVDARQPIAPEPLPSVEKALEIVHGAREEEYGHPADDLQRIADLWTASIVGRRHPISRRHPLEPDEVCMMMILLKTARLSRSPDHADSWADIVGYVVCRDRIVNRLGGWLDRAKRWIGGLL